MTTATAINDIGREIPYDDSTSARRSLRRWSAALFITALLGGVSGLAGLTVAFVSLVELVIPSTTLYTTGTVLIGASFILFGLTAHCIDKIADADTARRLDYCRQHGLKDDRDTKGRQ